MGFDLKKFRKAEFTERTEEVLLRDFAEGWFPEGEAPKFVVRGLSGVESALVEDAAKKYSHIIGAIDAISESAGSNVKDVFSELLNNGDKPNETFARIVETLRLGTVDPDFNYEDAVKFATNFPIDAKVIYYKIVGLTGKGRLPGESKPSGKKKTSKSQ